MLPHSLTDLAELGEADQAATFPDRQVACPVYAEHGLLGQCFSPAHIAGRRRHRLTMTSAWAASFVWLLT